MAITRKLTQSVMVGNELLQGQATLSAGNAVSMSEAIPDESTDLPVAFTLDISACQLLYVVSDQAIAVTFVGGAGKVVTLAANVPFLWFDGSGITQPLPADTTSLTVTNDSGATANLRIEVLVDPTP